MSGFSQGLSETERETARILEDLLAGVPAEPDLAHKGPRYVFSDAGVQVHRVAYGLAEEALRAAGYPAKS
jgi:hypothetical protein